MGWFSRKTRLLAGVSNSRLYKDREYPRALKDSTAAYLKDLPNMTNPYEIGMVDYNNMGIEESIVPAFRKAVRYVQKDSFLNSSKFQTTSYLIPDLAELRQAIIDEMKEEFGPSLVINYILMEEIDYAHLVKQFLMDDYSYNPISNSLTIEGQDYWLEDAILYLRTEPIITGLGNSFTAPEVPGRPWDSERSYTPWVYAEDIEKVEKINPRTGTVELVYPEEYYEFKEKAVLKLIEKYTHKFYERHDVITTYTTVTDPDTGEETIVEETTTTDPIITDIYNNLPNDVTLHEFRKVLEEETSEVIEDTTERKVIRITRRYDSSYYPETPIKDTYEVMLSDYFNEPPSIPEMGEWHEGDDQQEVDDYIDEFENGEEGSDIFNSSYIISISYSYINSDDERVETYRTLVDTRKDDTSLGLIYERYDNIIKGNMEFEDVGFLMPELFFRQFAKDLTKEDGTTSSRGRAYVTNKKYAKKLGIDYDSFIDNLYDSMIEDAEENGDVGEVKDNWSKVRSVCLVFGIPIDTDDPFQYKYLYEFFNIQVDPEKDNEALDNKTIVVKDRWSTDNYSWVKSSRTIIEGKLYSEDEEFEKDTYYSRKTEADYSDGHGFDVETRIVRIFSKQISPTQIEEIRIWGYTRDIRVTDKKWISGNSKEDQDAESLVPFSPGIALKYYTSFKDKEAIIYKAMFVEFITYVKQKEKWYETKWGKIAGIAVGAIVTFIYPPAFLAGAALSTAAMIVVSVLISTAISFAVSMAIKLIVKAFGLENSKYFAILATIGAIAFGAYSSIGSLVNTLKALQLFFNKITVYMLTAAKGLLTEISSVIGVELEEQARDNKEKLKELETQAEEMFDYLIDDTGDYLGSNRNYISPLLKLGSSVDQIMAEATNYNRMADVIDYVHNYPDHITSLPTLEETIQASYQSKQ